VSLSAPAVRDGIFCGDLRASTPPRSQVLRVLLDLCTYNEYMPVVKSNIKAFNTYVKLQLKMLTARGETTNDLLVHLFAANQKVSDKNFRDEAKEELKRYERGQAITPLQLMATMEQYGEFCNQAEGQAIQGQVERRKDAHEHTGPRIAPEESQAKPIDKVAYHRGLPWYWCSPENGGKSAGCWCKHMPKECKGTAWSTTSAT
jgi:hypothetical protein